MITVRHHSAMFRHAEYTEPVYRASKARAATFHRHLTGVAARLCLHPYYRHWEDRWWRSRPRSPHPVAALIVDLDSWNQSAEEWTVEIHSERDEEIWAVRGNTAYLVYRPARPPRPLIRPRGMEFVDLWGNPTSITEEADFARRAGQLLSALPLAPEFVR
mgnify:CR=1 FL=1